MALHYLPYFDCFTLIALLWWYYSNCLNLITLLYFFLHYLHYLHYFCCITLIGHLWLPFTAVVLRGWRVMLHYFNYIT